MKVYKLGDSETYYDLVIVEDNGEIRVATVSKGKVTEYIAKKHICKGGYIRLNFGTGSSIPFKDSDGNINKNFKELKYEEKKSI